MKIFVAGASGAIGQPLIAELMRHGHSVTGMTQSEAGAKKLIEQGASAEIANALDPASVEQALRRSEAEVVIDELTSLPKDPADFAAYSQGDRKLRIEGGGNLHKAALTCGVRRYLQQGSGYFFLPGQGLADESVGLAINATPSVAASAQMYAALEARTLQHQPMEGVVLRYGFFYGPNTWYNPDGGTADQVRHQQLPVIGDGQGVWSFVHIEDAAIATVAALSANRASTTSSTATHCQSASVCQSLRSGSALPHHPTSPKRQRALPQEKMPFTIKPNCAARRTRKPAAFSTSNHAACSGYSQIDIES